jgi:hypothetical protein
MFTGLCLFIRSLFWLASPTSIGTYAGGAKWGSSPGESEPQTQEAVQEGTSVFSLFIQLATVLPCNDHDALEKAPSLLKKLIK